MKALRIVASCLGPCGLLGEGLSTDPPQSRRPSNWKGAGDGKWGRWDELDRLAERHPHATRCSARPA